jgi:hypothetical protein
MRTQNRATWFLAFLAAMLSGCAVFDDVSIAPRIHRLEQPVTHGELKIFGWESAPIRNGKLVPKMRLLVATSPNSEPAFVPLSRGQSYRGLRLSQICERHDTIAGPSTWTAPVIITDIAFRLETPSPKRYLILRDVSGGLDMVFYSDEPHPALR